MTDAGEGLFAGARQFKFMRAFFGLSVTTVLGVVTALLTRPEPEERTRGLVVGTVADAIERYKGKPGDEMAVTTADATVKVASEDLGSGGSGQWPHVRISSGLAEALGATEGDILYVTDRRWWLGGLHSAHGVVSEVLQDKLQTVEMSADMSEVVVTKGRAGELVRVEKLY